MGWCRGVDTSLCRLSKTYLESAVILFKNSVSLCCVVLAKMSPSTASFWRRRRRRRRIWFISCWKTKCCPLESFKAQSLCQEGEEDPIMGKNDGIRLISTPCIAKKPTRDITETVMSSMNRIQLSDLLCCSVSSRDVLVVRLEKLPTMADFDQEQHVQEALRYLDQKDVKKVLRDLTESLLLRQPENPRVHMLEELWESTGRSWTPFAENIPCSFLEQKFPSPREAVGDMLRRAAGAAGVRRVSFFSAPNCRGRQVLGRGDASRFSGSDFLLVDSSDADLAVGQPGGGGWGGATRFGGWKDIL